MASTEISSDNHPDKENTVEAADSSTATRTTFPVGTRKSMLALAQTNMVVSLLQRAASKHSFPLEPLTTIGDKNQTTALHAFNAKALWTTELEEDLVAGRTDLIVHSLKDMPTQLPAGCALGACVLRSERRDCVVMGPEGVRRGWRTLADLPAGSVVGTSSVRRLAQLHRLFPHLKSENVRGNINTRLAKLDSKESSYAALILAATGLQRVGLGDRVSSFLSRREDEAGWLGAVGQGAIGIEVRADDPEVRVLCEQIMETGDAKHIFWECLAERSLLRALEGGCSVPIGVETEWEGSSILAMHALVSSVDGQKVVHASLSRTVASREQAEEFGLAVAGALVEKGAETILKEITLNRKVVEEAGGA